MNDLPKKQLRIETWPQRVAREIMEDQKLNPAGLAKKADVTQQAVYAWRNGTTKEIQPKAAFELQKTTGWSAEWIMQSAYAVKAKAAVGDVIDLTGLAEIDKTLIRRAAEAMINAIAETRRQQPEP